MAERLTTHEVEGLAAIDGMAPLSGESVGRLMKSHAALSRDWSEVEELLVRLAPAWAEVRSILNELNRVLGP